MAYVKLRNSTLDADQLCLEPSQTTVYCSVLDWAHTDAIPFAAEAGP